MRAGIYHSLLSHGPLRPTSPYDRTATWRRGLRIVGVHPPPGRSVGVAIHWYAQGTTEQVIASAHLNLITSSCCGLTDFIEISFHLIKRMQDIFVCIITGF